MNLANFPMDDQLCTVEVESFGYTMADLRLVLGDHVMLRVYSLFNILVFTAICTLNRS